MTKWCHQVDTDTSVSCLSPLQEELKMLRLRHALLLEEELNNREDELNDLLQFKKEMKVKTLSVIMKSKWTYDWIVHTLQIKYHFKAFLIDCRDNWKIESEFVIKKVLFLLQHLSNAALAQSRKQVDAFREQYDILVAEDKVMDKAFKREFHDVPAVQVEQLYKLFRRRPRYTSLCLLWLMIIIQSQLYL